MSMRNRSPTRRSLSLLRATAPSPRPLLAGLLGVSAALLVSCASSGKGLIPTGNAGPLQNDFLAVASAARQGNGSCTATEAAVAKTEQDYRALPATVDAGLRKRLYEGIAKLSEDAREVCAQPLAQTTTARTQARTTTSTQTTTTAPAVTQTTTTQSTPTTSTPTTSSPGGGTPAGEEGPSEGAGKGHGNGGEPGNSGGAEPNNGASGEGGAGANGKGK
jgi:hypothetical protein